MHRCGWKCHPSRRSQHSRSSRRRKPRKRSCRRVQEQEFSFSFRTSSSKNRYISSFFPARQRLGLQVLFQFFPYFFPYFAIGICLQNIHNCKPLHQNPAFWLISPTSGSRKKHLFLPLFCRLPRKCKSGPKPIEFRGPVWYDKIMIMMWFCALFCRQPQSYR